MVHVRPRATDATICPDARVLVGHGAGKGRHCTNMLSLRRSEFV